MSYSAYQYPSSGSSYDAFSQPYDQQSCTSVDQHTQLPQYSYSHSQSLDHYAHPAAPVPTDYGGYNSTTGTGYTPPPVASYPASSSSHTSYQYNQEDIQTDQFLSHPSDVTQVSFSTSASHYSGATAAQDQATSQSVSSFSPYQYQPTDFGQLSGSFVQDCTSSGYTGSYPQNGSSYSYQDQPSQSTNPWTSNGQYTSYNPPYYDESASYHHKVEPVYGNTDYPPSGDRCTQGSSSVDIPGGGYSQSDKYLVKQDGNYQGYVKPITSQDYFNPVSSQDYVKPTVSRSYVKPTVSRSYVKPTTSQSYAKPYASRTYVKPITSHVSKPQYNFAAYSTPEPLNRALENKNINSDKNYISEREDISVPALSSANYSSAEGRSGGRSDYQTGNRDNLVDRESSILFTGEQKFAYRNHQTFTSQRRFNNNNQSACNFSTRGAVSARGTFLSSNRGNRRNNGNKRPLLAFDARNKINESRSASMAENKLTRNLNSHNRNITNLPTSNKNKAAVSTFKPPESSKKEVFKTPSRPQDRLLNEIEEKEKAQRVEELKKSEDEQKKGEEKRLKDLEEENKKAEEIRQKAEEEALKAAPPSRPPETAEEIAHEEEIQRKIKESLVIIQPEREIALLKDDPSKEIDMPEDLRSLLNSQTTDYLCKLCCVWVNTPAMAAMHYNGKNHMRKVRHFVETNGRSAGYNLGTSDKSGKEEQITEIEELTDIDPKTYCKVCKITFSKESQADMHYKGKTHAKKLKIVGTGNGPQLFECMICCVSTTAQEHLNAHINGARHKLQVKKLDTNENYRGAMRGRGRGFGFRGQNRGRGGRGARRVNGGDWRSQQNTGSRGRGFRSRGGSAGNGFSWRGAEKRKAFELYTNEELMTMFTTDPNKKFQLDLANYRTPSGWFYCSYCDISMQEEPLFLLHLGSRDHVDELSGRKSKKRISTHSGVVDTCVYRSC